MKITNFLSRSLTENAKTDENHQEEFVINTIALLATVNSRIGRVFSQSESAKTDKMADKLDTNAPTGTRCRKTNKEAVLIES